MPPVQLATPRPSGLRVAGFLLVALGALLAGIGATRAWASIGFTADVEGVADVSVHGTDVWEGKVVVLGVTVALVMVPAMRLAGSVRTRRSMAVAIVAIGVTCTGLALADAVRVEHRFGGAGSLERYVSAIAAEVGLPEDVVREQLQEEFDRAGRVDLEPGLWLTAAGGLVLAAGGVLNVALARRRDPGLD